MQKPSKKSAKFWLSTKCISNMQSKDDRIYAATLEPVAKALSREETQVLHVAAARAKALRPGALYCFWNPAGELVCIPMKPSDAVTYRKAS